MQTYVKLGNMDLIERGDFDWTRFHAYRVFDEFLERFVIDRKSYVTRHEKNKR